MRGLMTIVFAAQLVASGSSLAGVGVKGDSTAESTGACDDDGGRPQVFTTTTGMTRHVCR